MKILAWFLKLLKEEPSILIQLPTCKQRSLISKNQDVWFNQLHGYSVITPDIHPSLLQSGNLVQKDILSITSTWKLTTEGFTHPHLCTMGCFFFFLLLNGHRSQNTATLHRSPCYPTGIFTIWQPASGRLSVFSASASKMSHRKETRRKEKPSRKDSITKCQVLTKTEKYKHIFRHMNTHAYTRTFFFWHLEEFVCILQLEAIISLMGKKYCCLFVLYFVLSPSLDCPLVLLHPCTLTYYKYIH